MKLNYEGLLSKTALDKINDVTVSLVTEQAEKNKVKLKHLQYLNKGNFSKDNYSFNFKDIRLSNISTILEENEQAYYKCLTLFTNDDIKNFKKQFDLDIDNNYFLEDIEIIYNILNEMEENRISLKEAVVKQDKNSIGELLKRNKFLLGFLENNIRPIYNYTFIDIIKMIMMYFGPKNTISFLNAMIVNSYDNIRETKTQKTKIINQS